MRTSIIAVSALVSWICAVSCSRQDTATHGVTARDATSATPPAPTPAAAATTLGTSADTGAISTSRIPLVAGLTVVLAVIEPVGDYESLHVIDSISPSHYRMARSGEVPNGSGGLTDVQVIRTVSTEDQRNARAMRNYFHTGDPEEFAGTTPGVSTAFVKDLRSTGKSALTFLDVGEVFGVSEVRRTLSGTLARVERQDVPIPTLVNGRAMALPAIHARGSLSDGTTAEDFEMYVLDDPDNPIVLRKRGPGFSSSVIKIQFPEAAARDSMENDLAASRPVDVYGVYFSFNRADIRAQSEPVLQEIASVLKKNPDWHLRIDGHTDNVGGDASNLELSRRRAAAVKDALVQRYGIDASRLTTGGYGASSPKDRNDTPEGRARNRRVELQRQ
jgi:outer membrane protein OmpA-like peptidoglycan-associated protein